MFATLTVEYDVLPVVAIGNEYHGNSSSPGNAPHALAIGAVEKMTRNRIEVASFSGGASFVFPCERPPAMVTKPDVVAPGVEIFSSIPSEKKSDGSYECTCAYMHGTSIATPHVSGLAALLMSARPEMAAFNIFAALKETAKHPDGEACRPDNRWGYGLIQPAEALIRIYFENF